MWYSKKLVFLRPSSHCRKISRIPLWSLDFPGFLLVSARFWMVIPCYPMLSPRLLKEIIQWIYGFFLQPTDWYWDLSCSISTSIMDNPLFGDHVPMANPSQDRTIWLYLCWLMPIKSNVLYESRSKFLLGCASRLETGYRITHISLRNWMTHISLGITWDIP